VRASCSFIAPDAWRYDPAVRAPLRFVAYAGAGRGAFRKVWPPLAEALAERRLDHEVVLTEGAGHAAELARRAVEEGARLIVGVGGDGTLHEIVNGVLGEAERAPDGVAVGLVPAGRGSDYARGLGFDQSPAALAARFGAALEGDASATRRVDVGEVTYRPSVLVAGRPIGPAPAIESENAVRRFVNEAGIGFSPFVAQRTARFPPRLGSWLYTVAGLVTIVDWRHRELALQWDAGDSLGDRVEGRFTSVELALGRYAGGGMLVAPDAVPDDGLFDAVVIGEAGRAELFSFSWRLRSGDHLRSPVVSVRRAATLSAEVLDGRGPLYLQADGELLGRDPVTFRILPDALTFAG
jgi:diacylglycerol kinase (ATP)